MGGRSQAGRELGHVVLILDEERDAVERTDGLLVRGAPGRGARFRRDARHGQRSARNARHPRFHPNGPAFIGRQAIPTSARSEGPSSPDTRLVWYGPRSMAARPKTGAKEVESVTDRAQLNL